MTGMLVVLAQIVVSSAPPLSPDEAVKVLLAGPGRANIANAPAPSPNDGPIVVVVGSSTTAGPFGEFVPFPVPRRLDGTLLSQRPWRPTVYVGRSFGTQGRTDHERGDLRSHVDGPVRRR